jgi:catechol 2,3-dioxygenase-like lactoylglutathione lyase family enzyme
MIDHISIRVTDLDRAVAFYKAALAPIGYTMLREYPGVVALGENGKPDLWIMCADKPGNPTHLAFHADRSKVDAFHAAALAAGAVDNGPPGPRPIYHDHYYGAFVLDPDGNNVEVVCHYPPGGAPKPVVAAKVPKVKSAAKQPAMKTAAKKPAARAKKPVAKAKAKTAAAPRAAKKSKPTKRR